MTTTHSWQSIQEDVRRRIVEGVWRPGELIPTEAQLALEYNCARATINRALRGLADVGLLERRRKAGTRIAVEPTRYAKLEINVIRLDVERRGEVYRHALIERKRIPPTELIRSRMNLESDTNLLFIRGLHFADEVPFVYEERWVNIVVTPEILDADLNTISANEWLVQNVPFTSGDISFSATNIDAKEAEFFDTQEGSAAFAIDRTTWQDQQCITSVRMLHRPGFRMRAVLS